MEAWKNLDGKTIVVTGGTGSFGRKFTEVVLAKHDPKAIRVYSRDELKQSQMAEQIPDKRVRFFIGDVRDKERLARAMYGADVVVHAAALKQVPAAEYNPLEAVKTNIMGTANVIDAAIDSGVERALMIGTDKAVLPSNLYGATKLVAEKLFVQANSYTGGRETRLACIRYGNVVGSRGSVIERFLRQRDQGVIQLTDERMTRFWITIGHGVRFVIDRVLDMGGGEIFVPKIPSMRLVDVASTIAPDARWEFIGIRDGEKLAEDLIPLEEASRTREFDSYYVIDPQHHYWDAETVAGGKPVPPDFHYHSDSNSWWLTKEELERAVAEP